MGGSVVWGEGRSNREVPTHRAGGFVNFEPFVNILAGHAQGVSNQMIQNTARPRGRPRSFDESEAMEKATQVVWSKGYDGVTIDDLVAGMGVGRPHIDAVFGDMRTL